jgi:hypothetical protein
VSIVDNDFDLANDVPRTTIGTPVFMIYTSGIDADIARNRLRNASRNSIEVIDNFRGADGKGRIVIRENDIETPAAGAPIPTPRGPNGVVVGYFIDPAAALDPARAIDHAVTRNTIRAAALTPASVAISVLADRASIEQNRVVLAGPGVIGILVAGSGNQVLRNRIEGSGAAGIVLSPVPPLKASANDVVDNDVAGLKVPRAAVGLTKGADRNRLSGTGTVLDAGEGNAKQGLQAYVEPPK